MTKSFLLFTLLKRDFSITVCIGNIEQCGKNHYNNFVINEEEL